MLERKDLFISMKLKGQAEWVNIILTSPKELNDFNRKGASVRGRSRRMKGVFLRKIKNFRRES